MIMTEPESQIIDPYRKTDEFFQIRVNAKQGTIDGYFDRSRQMAVERYIECFAGAKGMIDEFYKKHYDQCSTFHAVDDFLYKIKYFFGDLFPGMKIPSVDIKR